ncbi:acyl-CoA dehydrogenase family protein [Microbacterium sp. BG28]|uniref:acyl-CoA dehydrogenase family protein n=1 Tax=Microbacterium sp. BG28 TaxID=3097356 RepID=UPI002A5A77ED|nr:acyl-CoA dehydrogenase family protein [Microbacterium sp. BG28]MDY0829817.1 acyl-CoA dehydrogenase family protein [Microbacterium sp. BG28]
MNPRLRSEAPFGHDPLGYAEAMLSEGARAALARLDDTLRTRIAPLLPAAWESATLPAAVLDALAPLDLMQPVGVEPAEAASSVFSGYRAFVLARTDVSVATAYNAQSGLFRTAVRRGGSPEQVAALDDAIRSFALRGVFALTEPDHGSDIAGGLATTATREGDGWVIDGAKRWIGGADTADVLVVFARAADDGEVKAFLVPRDAPGVTLTRIEGKVSLRPMQNFDIRLEGVRVEESARLQRVDSWRDVAEILRSLRSDVAWIATGLQAGALDAAVGYVREREQFGSPLGGFQLVQEKLARILGNLTASLGIVTRLSARQDAGVLRDEDSALAKMQTARLARESVALAREVQGGNGILLAHGAARFFADAEAVYSYEGTHEMTALIVGRGLTGSSAFV